jgi:hypothetical protein
MLNRYVSKKIALKLYTSPEEISACKVGTTLPTWAILIGTVWIIYDEILFCRYK